jgi:formate hydrogenlyase subunit 3/multisubunit Na+/H+ antiporter MnhD subunit
LAIAGLAGQTRRDLPAISLVTLAVGALALGLTNPGTALTAATAGGLVGAMLCVDPGGDRGRATVGFGLLRAGVVAGTLAIAAAAWIGPDAPGLGLQPFGFGLAYLAVALAVAIRFGAIPFHGWAARLTDAVPSVGLPIVTVLAAAPFAIVGLGWVDGTPAPPLASFGTERAIVLAVAGASILLAALAALVQDDLDHVVGYSIVGDAGVALLALAAFDPAASAPGRTWILGMVVTRSAFAAWAGGLRVQRGSGRIIELRGWASRSPVLAVAFGLIVMASLGFPGFAAFEARSSLVELAVEGPLATMVLLGTLTPIAFYGRLLVIGLGRPEWPPQSRQWRPRLERPDLMAVRAWVGMTWETNRAFSSAVVAVLLAALAVATSAGAFGGPEAAAGPAPTP